MNKKRGSLYLGIEIGGTKLQAGVCDERGRVCDITRAAVDRKAGARGIRAQLRVMVPALLRKRTVQGIGIGFGGPVDREQGVVVISHQIGGWSGFALRRWCERQWRLPVTVDNDANVAALAEAVCGAGKGCGRVLYVTVGTGIGAGLVMDGDIYNGHFGAMELGHTKLWIDGRDRTLESVASGLAIEKGVSTVGEAARLVGMGLANAVTLLNPDVVVVGGGVTEAGARFMKPLRETVKAQVFGPFRARLRVVRGRLARDVVVVGAAMLAARANRNQAGLDCG